MVDERILAERLISYDTSRPEAIVAAAGFVKGWLESRDIEVHHHDHNGLPVLVAEVGPGGDAHDAPCVVLHGHLDVVPGRPEQFAPQMDGDRLQQAERELESADEDSEKRRVAERDKRRLEQFLRISESS
jgi:succinyl-diaminopimelate desuccinylase